MAETAIREDRLRAPTGWPRSATPCDLVPIWAGEFRDFNDWVNHAQHRLVGVTGSVGEKVDAICVDALGRRCNVGKDFQRARDENAFPVRYFWECRSPSAEAAAVRLAMADAPQDGTEIVGILHDGSEVGMVWWRSTECWRQTLGVRNIGEPVDPIAWRPMA